MNVTLIKSNQTLSAALFQRQVKFLFLSLWPVKVIMLQLCDFMKGSLLVNRKLVLCGNLSVMFSDNENKNSESVSEGNKTYF